MRSSAFLMIASSMLGIAATASAQNATSTAGQRPATQQPSQAQAAAVRAPALTPTVRRGELDIVALPDPATGVQWGRATGTIDAPPELVMQIVTDYAKYAEFLPNFEASRVLSQRGNNAIVYLQARAVRNTMTLWAQLRIFQRRPQGQTQIVEGRMMQGNVTRMDARWEVTPIEGGTRTLLAFQFLIDPDLPFPDSIVSEENRRAARRTLEAVRRRITEPRFAVARAGTH